MTLKSNISFNTITSCIILFFAMLTSLRVMWRKDRGLLKYVQKVKEAYRPVKTLRSTTELKFMFLFRLMDKDAS